MSQGRPQIHEERSDHPFGVALKQFLSQKNLSQVKLSQATELDPAVINKMVKGQRLEGPGGRHRVLLLIRGLHQLGVLTSVDEANSLLTKVPTLGPLDTRVKEELELLRILQESGVRSQESEENAQGIEDRGWRVEDKGRGLETRGQGSEVRSQESEEVIIGEGSALENASYLATPLKENLVPDISPSLTPVGGSSAPDISIAENSLSSLSKAEPSPTIYGATLLEKSIAITDSEAVLTSSVAGNGELTTPNPRPSTNLPPTIYHLPSTIYNRLFWVVVLGVLVLLIIGGTSMILAQPQTPKDAAVAKTTIVESVYTPQPISPTNAGTVDLLASVQVHNSRVNSVAFSPNGQLLASGSEDKTVSLSQVATKERIYRLEGHLDAVSCVTFSPNGQLLASASLDKTVNVWRVADGFLVRKLEKHSGAVSSATFSPNGEYLATASYDRIVYLWRVSDGVLIRKLEGHTGTVTSLSFSSDGTMLASASYDSTVVIWKASDGALLRKLEAHTGVIGSIAFLPHSNVLASGSYDGTVRLWNADDGVLLKTMEARGGVNGLTFNQQGTLLAIVGGTSGKPTIWLRRMRDGALLLELNPETYDAVRGVAFNPAGDLIATPFDDKIVRLWGVSRKFYNDKFVITS